MGKLLWAILHDSLKTTRMLIQSEMPWSRLREGLWSFASNFARIPGCAGSATLPVVDKYGSVSVREGELTLLFPRGEGE